MLTTIILIASIGLIGLTTMSFLGGVYANRSALPVVGSLFVLLLLFGAMW
jgi:hypothetical protein